MSRNDDFDGLNLLGADDFHREDFFPEVPGHADVQAYGARKFWLGDAVVTVPTVGANYADAKTVAAVQQALVNKGYDCGSTGPNGDGVDGLFGPSTKKAILKLQSDLNLAQSGKIDEGVIMALKVTPGVLPPGVTLKDQAALQAQVALDAATAAEHAQTPSDVQAAATQAQQASDAAAPPPPPDVQAKLKSAVAQAKAAKTPAQVQAAAAAVKDAATDVHASVKPSWWVEPAWPGGWPRWEVGSIAGGTTVALAVLLAAVL